MLMSLTFTYGCAPHVLDSFNLKPVKLMVMMMMMMRMMMMMMMMMMAHIQAHITYLHEGSAGNYPTWIS